MIITDHNITAAIHEAVVASPGGDPVLGMKESGVENAEEVLDFINLMVPFPANAVFGAGIAIGIRLANTNQA